jgi:hypothetical protein
VGTNPIFGTITLLPIVVSFLFVLPHWWSTEKTAKRRYLTFPLVLFQIWPQFRVIELLVLLWKQEYDKFVVKKEHYYRNLSSLGKFTNKKIIKSLVFGTISELKLTSTTVVIFSSFSILLLPITHIDIG